MWPAAHRQALTAAQATPPSALGNAGGGDDQAGQVTAAGNKRGREETALPDTKAGSSRATDRRARENTDREHIRGRHNTGSCDMNTSNEPN